MSRLSSGINESRFRSELFRMVTVILFLSCVSGCVSNNVTPQIRSVTTDMTFGNYENNLEQDLILITMTPAEHDQLTTTNVSLTAEALPTKYVAFINNLKSTYGLTRVADWPLPAINIYCIIFENDGPLSREALIRALPAEPEIESAQVVNSFQIQGKEYNDPYLSLQHGFHSMQALNSHTWSSGDGVRVAVVDTGLDSKHPDLVSNTELIRNFVDQNEVEFHTDIHGTAVGGIIAATANNATGMVGIAPGANLLSLKACWYPQSDNDGAQCNSLTLAKALNFAIQEDVDIINLSLTGPPDPLLSRLVEAAMTNNIIVVGARPGHNSPAFPTSIAGTIAVAMPSAQKLPITAPGRRVFSTLPDEQYDFFDGSSFSTAHISGLAAVIRGLSPTLSPASLLSLLEETADPDSGAVNACRAVQVLTKTSNESNTDNKCL
ncbi:MAG: S8 family serine peptidase [Granulosicoccus sp.]